MRATIAASESLIVMEAVSAVPASLANVRTAISPEALRSAFTETPRSALAILLPRDDGAVCRNRRPEARGNISGNNRVLLSEGFNDRFDFRRMCIEALFESGFHLGRQCPPCRQDLRFFHTALRRLRVPNRFRLRRQRERGTKGLVHTHFNGIENIARHRRFSGIRRTASDDRKNEYERERGNEPMGKEK